MARKLFNYIVLFSIGFVSCKQQETKLTIEEKKLIADTVRKVLYQYFEDVNKSGLMAELKYLDSTADFFWIPPGYTDALSYDSVVSALKYNAQHFFDLNNTWDTLKITPLSKEIVVYSGKMHFRATSPPDVHLSGKLIESGILIKRKDGWKLISGHTRSLE